MDDDHILYFGERDTGWTNGLVGITDRDRTQHVYIVGRTGVGKSKLMEALVLQDIFKGRGCAFLDPHGTSVEEILRHIPSHRTREVVYFCPSDLERPFGLNLLEGVPYDSVHLVAQGIVEAFKNIWSDSWGPRMDRVLYNAVSALIDRGNSTLLGVLRLLVDEGYRRRIVPYITDPVIRTFWEHEFEEKKEQFRQEAVDPIQNKVERFLSNPLMRHILGQKKSTIDLEQIMKEDKVFLVNLSKADMGALNSHLMGSLLVTLFQLSAQRRRGEDQSNESHGQPPLFPLFIDEFQNFTTDSFKEILSESRKHGLGLHVAHQHIGQLKPPIRDAVLENVGTIVAFRVGVKGAATLTDELEFNVETLSSLNAHEACIKPLVEGVVQSPQIIKTFRQAPSLSGTRKAKPERVIHYSRDNYGRDRRDVEERIKLWMEGDAGAPSVGTLKRIDARIQHDPPRKNRG